MNFKKLQPLPLRRECEPNYHQQIWQPNWCCFCCHDTGFVADKLASYVIEGYIGGQHKIARCQATRCIAEIGETLEVSGTLDERLTPDICDRLDRLERQNWMQTIEKQYELKQRTLGLIDELAQRKSIRPRRRTLGEEMSAQRKHQDILNSL